MISNQTQSPLKLSVQVTATLFVEDHGQFLSSDVVEGMNKALEWARLDRCLVRNIDYTTTHSIKEIEVSSVAPQGKPYFVHEFGQTPEDFDETQWVLDVLGGRDMCMDDAKADSELSKRPGIVEALQYELAYGGGGLAYVCRKDGVIGLLYEGEFPYSSGEEAGGCAYYPPKERVLEKAKTKGHEIIKLFPTVKVGMPEEGFMIGAAIGLLVFVPLHALGAQERSDLVDMIVR